MNALLLLLYLYALFIGTRTTSFLNVVIRKLPQGLPSVKERSHCPSCHHKLQWYDLFPMFNYLPLKGKRRHYGNKTSTRETVSEFLGGCIGMFCFYTYGFSWDTVLVFVVFMVLFTTTMIDFDTMTVPNGLIISLIVPVDILTALHPKAVSMARTIGFFIVSLSTYPLTLLIPDCFGSGDIKLVTAVGFLPGWKLAFLVFFTPVLIGGGYAVYLLLSRKAQKGVHIAFGSHLRIGITTSLLHGETLTQGYLPLFKL